MRFDPLSEEDLQKQRGVLTPGLADFEVIESVDTLSKEKKTPMIKLTLKVWDCNGTEGFIFDYLVSTVQWKIKRFFDSIGNPDSYLSGNMEASSLIGNAGKAVLEIQKDRSGKYGDQIKIKDYFRVGDATLKDAKEVMGGEDIPF